MWRKKTRSRALTLARHVAIQVLHYVTYVCLAFGSHVLRVSTVFSFIPPQRLQMSSHPEAEVEIQGQPCHKLM